MSDPTDPTGALESHPIREAVARYAPIIALILVCALIALYIVDYAVLRVRVARHGSASALSTVTVLYAAKLKDNKLNIFFDQPTKETCVRSIFPALGYTPCWYASRHNLRVVD